MPKLVLPRKELIFLAGNFLFSALVTYVAFHDWLSTPAELSEDKFRNLLTLLGCGAFTLFSIKILLQQLFKAYTLRFQKADVTFIVPIEGRISLVIGPIYGLENKALIVRLNCVPQYVETEPPKSFRLHKQFKLPDVHYTIYIIGIDGNKQHMVARKSFSHNLHTELTEELPVEIYCDEYFFHVNASIRENLHLNGCQLQVHLAAGLKAQSWKRHSEIAFQEAQLQVKSAVESL